MLKKHIIRKNHYSDSVALMRIAADLEALPGIHRATLIMATEANLELARTADLIDETVAAQPNNLLLAVIANDEDAAMAAFAQAQDQLENAGSNENASDAQELEAKSIEMSIRRDPNINFALISCPGEYAAAEAKKALNLGLHVMVFSDNVSIEDEVDLKTIGLAKDLMVMGPDCGTAIINGLPLGFANAVARGPVGIVAASGTGLQQVSSFLSQWNVGISHAIGTGGRDLSSEIGGIAMIQGIKILVHDTETKAIVLISKPPSSEVAEKILDVARTSGKPIIVCFLGSEKNSDDNSLDFASTLDEAATLAYSKINPGKQMERLIIGNNSTDSAKTIVQTKDQKYLRGIYSGGTFCYETQFILRKLLGPIWSSTPIDKSFKLLDSWVSQEHTVIDLGEDEFSQGRPHPMIDHRTRHERILQEASDPETAVILFDVVIGFGSHENPAAQILASIQEARKIAEKDDRQIYFVGFVCGTDLDPQNLSAQIDILKSADIILAESNAGAAHQAASLILANSGAALQQTRKSN